MNDTLELKNLILENPELPLLVFCGEEAWSGEYGYEQADVNSVKIKEMTLYGEYWLDADDYEEQLADGKLMTEILEKEEKLAVLQAFLIYAKGADNDVESL